MAVFGLGLAALGRPGYMTLAHAADFPSTTVEAMRAQAFEVLDSAFAAGLRHLDTARSYGRAEEFLREWLDSRKPTGVRVLSKWGYRYTADWKSNAAVHEVKDALAQPFLDVVLCGAATRAQLKSNVKATAVSDRDWERVSVSPTAFWEARSKLSWS